jgi:hypothetical protein
MLEVLFKSVQSYIKIYYLPAGAGPGTVKQAAVISQRPVFEIVEMIILSG